LENSRVVTTTTMTAIVTPRTTSATRKTPCILNKPILKKYFFRFAFTMWLVLQSYVTVAPASMPEASGITKKDSPLTATKNCFLMPSSWPLANQIIQFIDIWPIFASMWLINC